MTLIRATLNPDGTIFIEDNHSPQLIQGRIDPLRVDQTSDDDINRHIIADMAAVQQDATFAKPEDNRPGGVHRLTSIDSRPQSAKLEPRRENDPDTE